MKFMAEFTLKSGDMILIVPEKVSALTVGSNSGTNIHIDGENSWRVTQSIHEVCAVLVDPGEEDAVKKCLM